MAIADSKAGTEAESAGKQREEAQQSVVCSYNEWDPLEEVIVGRVEGAAVPPWHVSIQSSAPSHSWELLKMFSGKPAPPAFVDADVILDRIAFSQVSSPGICVAPVKAL